METSYLPVEWVHREVIEEAIERGTEGKIFYFSGSELGEAKGKIIKMEEVSQKGVFIQLDDATEIRIDRIITLFGKPGAAYEEYEAYSNACMDCSGGYTKDELDNM